MKLDPKTIRVVAQGALLVAVLLAFVGFVWPTKSRRLDSAEAGALVAACRTLFAAEEPTWIFNSPGYALPMEVARLKPQMVDAVRTPEGDFIDIQTSGGFNHGGYMVVVRRASPSFHPSKGGWSSKEVWPNVFEYRE